MIDRETVFVIGAGASRELALPVGDTLKSIISDLLRIDHDSYDYFTDKPIGLALLQHVGSSWNHQMATWGECASHLAKSMPLAPSIDNFLEAHQDNDKIILLGKLAIARAILRAERGSYLYGKRGARTPLHLPLHDEMLVSSWHTAFFRMLVSGHTIESVVGILEQTSFVVFNYDRCIEHFLVLALRQYFNIDETDASSILASVRIYHPYGQVGDLPWQNRENPISFGSDEEPESLLAVARQIRTYTESVDSGLVNKVRDVMANAETVVFMGYGFAQQNNQLLSVEIPNKTHRVFTTTCGLSETDAFIAMQDIRRILDYAYEYNDLDEIWNVQYFDTRGTCSDLMAAHRLRLTRY